MSDEPHRANVLMEELRDHMRASAEWNNVILGKVDGLTAKVDGLTAGMATLTGRVDILTGRVDVLSGRVDRLDERLGRVEVDVRVIKKHVGMNGVSKKASPRRRPPKK